MIAKMPVKVGFDPAKSAESRCADVWNIPAGRILMLLWRPCHLCSDRWWDEALNIARAIHKKRPKTADELYRRMTAMYDVRRSDFGHSDCLEFSEDAIDYFTGVKGVEYQGVVNGVAIMEPGKDRYI